MFNSKTKNSFRGKINTTTTENNNENNGKVSSSENLSPKNSGLSYFNTSSLTRIFKGPTNFVQSFGSVVTSKSIQPTSSSTSLNPLKKDICSNSVIFKSKIEPDAVKSCASSGSDGSGDDGGFCDEKKTKVKSIKSHHDLNDLSIKLNLKCNEKKIENSSNEQNCVFETVKIGKSPNSSLNRKQNKPQKNGGTTIKKLNDESLNYSKSSDCTSKTDQYPAKKTSSIINDNMSLSSLNQDKINTTSINNVCLENGNENGDVLGVIKSDSIKCLTKKTDDNKLDDFPKNYEFSSFKTLSFGSPMVPNFDFKNSFNSLNNNSVLVSQELQDIKEEILNNNEFSVVAEESNKMVKSKNPFHLSMNESDILLSTNNNFLNSFVNGNVDESSSSRQTVEEKIISPDVMSALQIFLSEHGNDYIRQFFQVIIFCWLYYLVNYKEMCYLIVNIHR